MQPIFENNAVSAIKVIIWLEQQIAIGKPFTLEYRDSSFEEIRDGKYVDHGIALINTLKEWTKERNILEGWLVAAGGNNYGDIGLVEFKPRVEESVGTEPFVGTWPSKWW